MIDWQTDGMDDFDRTFRRYRQVSSKSLEDALKHRVGRLGWRLFSLFNREARKTQRAIKRLPASRIRPRNWARSQKQEKARRIYAAGFAAAGWIVSALRFRRAGSSVSALNKVDDLRGRVSVNLRGPIRSAELVNYAPGAWETDRKHGLSEKARRIETADMQKYLDRKAAENIRRSGF